MPADFGGFYQKEISQRRAILATYLEEEGQGQALETALALPESVANQLIENYVGNYSLPFGLAPTFKINGRDYVVPMAIEEPSVVAAASNGGKRLGNIQSQVLSRQLIGQIVLTDIEDLTAALEQVIVQKDHWLDLARAACPSMVARGGGPCDLWADSYGDDQGDFLCVYLSLDPCEAMGANVMNTVLETLAPEVEASLGGQALLRILSNHGDKLLVKAQVSLPVSQLHANPVQALNLAKRLSQASRVAQLDPRRAVTHNKGIMNGVDAVLLATGNDWRAVEAGVHAHAARDGQYRGLSQWTLSADQARLEGELTLPLSLATVGGTLAVHPTAQLALAILGKPNARELSQIIAAVGLAQNFAALRALVTDGIQKGHMALQARSLALQVGASLEEVPALVKALRQAPAMNRTLAEQVLAQLRSQEGS